MTWHDSLTRPCCLAAAMADHPSGIRPTQDFKPACGETPRGDFAAGGLRLARLGGFRSRCALLESNDEQ
jgi:hypothetical protein